MTDFDKGQPGSGRDAPICADSSPRSFADWFDFAVRARRSAYPDDDVPRGHQPLRRKSGSDA